MSTRGVRSVGITVGIALGGAAVAAAVAGVGTASAQTSDLGSVLVAALGDVATVANHDLGLLTAELGVANPADFSTATLDEASANLTQGVNVLAQQLVLDPTASGLASAISLQSHSLTFIDSLQDAQDNISAHLGSLSPTVEDLFFDPLNQFWLTSSESMLTADHAFADALINDLSGSDLLSVRMDLLTAEFNLLVAQTSSLPFLFVSSLFGDSAGL